MLDLITLFCNNKLYPFQDDLEKLVAKYKKDVNKENKAQKKNEEIERLLASLKEVKLQVESFRSQSHGQR